MFDYNKITLALGVLYLKLVSGMWSGQFSCVRVRYGLNGGERETATLEVGLNEIGCRGKERHMALYGSECAGPKIISFSPSES